MLPLTGQVLALRDQHGHLLGQVTVESREGELIEGQFVAGDGYARVADLFRAFAEAAEQQALGGLDQLDQQIAALGLRLHPGGDAEPLDVRDVQIWGDGGMSCRLTRWAAELNGGLSGSPARAGGEPR